MTGAGELESLISQQIITAMKAHDAERTGTLRLIKNALKNKAIEKRTELTQAESEQVLASMIKQRRDSIDQFTKGNRLDLADKEAIEIAVIEEFLPKALDEAALTTLVTEAVAEVSAALGHKPVQKEMGPVMKVVQAKLQAAGARADGRLISEAGKEATRQIVQLRARELFPDNSAHPITFIAHLVAISDTQLVFSSLGIRSSL